MSSYDEASFSDDSRESRESTLSSEMTGSDDDQLMKKPSKERKYTTL